MAVIHHKELEWAIEISSEGAIDDDSSNNCTVIERAKPVVGGCSEGGAERARNGSPDGSGHRPSVGFFYKSSSITE
jgi:hypothetical protein